MQKAIIALVAILLAACDANAPLRQAAESAVQHEQKATEECDAAREAAESDLAYLRSQRQELRELRAAKEYESIAASGDAGTQEALMVASKMAHDSGYASDRDRRIEELEGNVASVEGDQTNRKAWVKSTCDRQREARAATLRAQQALVRAQAK